MNAHAAGNPPVDVPHNNMMKHTVWLIIFFCFPFCLFSQSIPLLVITDLRVVTSGSSIAEANAFSEFIRREIEQTGQYRVLSRSSMLAILKNKHFKLPCYELPCFTEMGSLLGADQVLAGNIHRDDEHFEITLRLIDCKENTILNTVYHTKANLSEAELFGNWGKSVIEDVFAFSENPHSKVILKEDGRIPERILNKYPGMIYIPAGEVYLGSITGDDVERPVQRKLVDAFYISKFEVTNREYKKFVDATYSQPPPHWTGGIIPIGLENHPVVWVSYENADSYCNWIGARLPTETEWERAAKANQQWDYPWGMEFDADKANTWEAGRRGTAPVGLMFRGASPFGVEDMSGNAFEWVSGFFESHSGKKSTNTLFDQHLRVLKGGSWNFNAYYARVSHRFPRSGGENDHSYGFRIARDG